LNAVDKANEIGMITIGWTGQGGVELAQRTEHSVEISSCVMQHIEDLHMILGHVLLFGVIEAYNEKD
jgi:phosphoheptose isomerase